VVGIASNEHLPVTNDLAHHFPSLQPRTNPVITQVEEALTEAQRRMTAQLWVATEAEVGMECSEPTVFFGIPDSVKDGIRGKLGLAPFEGFEPSTLGLTVPRSTS
jgi:hypothetical protein